MLGRPFLISCRENISVLLRIAENHTLLVVEGPSCGLPKQFASHCQFNAVYFEPNIRNCQVTQDSGYICLELWEIAYEQYCVLMFSR